MGCAGSKTKAEAVPTPTTPVSKSASQAAPQKSSLKSSNRPPLTVQVQNPNAGKEPPKEKEKEKEKLGDDLGSSVNESKFFVGTETQLERRVSLHFKSNEMRVRLRHPAASIIENKSSDPQYLSDDMMKVSGKYFEMLGLEAVKEASLRQSIRMMNRSESGSDFRDTEQSAVSLTQV